MSEGSSGAYVANDLARAIPVKIKINPNNSKVRFFRKFVKLFKKFVFISNRFTYFLSFLWKWEKFYNMKKQRICIVGDGLSGLMSAIALNNLPNLEVHLIAKKKKPINDKRATAMSASNFKFFQDIISKFDKKLFWPSKKINLF